MNYELKTMATDYIKVRPFVARTLGLEGLRSTYPDGCVQLYAKDLSLIDRGYCLSQARRTEAVARIGGLLMDPYRNRQEHDCSADTCAPHPHPPDPAYIDPDAPTVESETGTSDTSEATESTSAEPGTAPSDTTSEATESTSAELGTAPDDTSAATESTSAEPGIDTNGTTAATDKDTVEID